MPWRLRDDTAKIQFCTAHWMPYRIYEACVATETVSNSRYIQEAVCERLARDLNLDYGELVTALPPPRSRAKHLFVPGSVRPIEEVQ